MLFYTGLILLVIAVSLDSFSAGIVYGIRNIRVPFNALLIIMICSGVIVFVSMTIGSMFLSVLTPDIASTLGGSILIILGGFAFTNCLRSNPNLAKQNQDRKQNILATVLSTPDKADLDRSGTISPGEAVLLGLALALDAFGAGIGASMLGYEPIVTAILIACMSGIFLFFGLSAGRLLIKSKHMQQLTFLPPLLLITLGISNLIH
ncbi:sporulation membrane protein YtaF [Virgibacillus pantothenticus]|uniref:sporulation membrane protein YtaF n=1 Tax=Virgibacillus pantothenticus TaxID=1473 RepID=UPI000987025A|nr:sporulation membrane protein YtaF [Virgibacillus pantothenticus]